MRHSASAAAAAALLSTLIALPASAQGYGQALLVTENELLVGESLDANRPGYVYVYRKDGTGRWVESAKLQASDAAPNDHFGRALALAEGDLLVGATVARESGALYIFRRGANGAWAEVASMVPSDAHADHSFGRVAATDGRTVLMADWAADSSAGAVYVFEKRDGAWRETAKLAASDREANDWFGASLAIRGNRIAVGARNKTSSRGAAYIFTRDADGRWTQSARLVPPDTLPNIQFGAALAFAGDALLVGAPGANQYLGAVFAYRPQGDGWLEESRVVPPAGTPQSNSFGSALAAVGDDVWAGTPGIESGRVFRLARGSDGWWAVAGEIAAADLSQGDGFGGALAALGDIALASAIGDDFGMGSTLVYERRGGAWTEAGRLLSEVKGLDPVTGGRVDCAGGKASTFACGEVDMLSFLPVQRIGGARGVQLNDVWGWTDPVTGKEWAIVGRYDGTSFIDLSDPTRPVFVGDLPKSEGSRANTWRDIKVYRDHAYIVADGAGQHGMQVFDLTRLRVVAPSAMPVTFTTDAHYDRIASAHNIVINEATGYAYAVGSSSGGETCGGGLHMIDIREPKQPKFAGCFNDTQTGNQRTGYTHDAQCVVYQGPDATYRGREICFGSNETALSIADVTRKDSTVAIARASYPNVGYAHQGWLDAQQEYFYMNDEGDEVSGTVQHTRTLVWDVRDLDDPIMVKEYFGPSTSSDHNLYVVGNLMYQSNYVSGLRIVDIGSRTEPKEVGFFDTVTATDDPGFDGSWSNYPFFASGTIVVTSGKEGVFFLRRATRVVS